MLYTYSVRVTPHLPRQGVHRVSRLHLSSGNMHMLDLIANDSQRRQYLEPMLSGERIAERARFRIA